MCQILNFFTGPNPNNNPHCQNMVFITGNQGSTSARIVDTCPACAQGNIINSPCHHDIK